MSIPSFRWAARSIHLMSSVGLWFLFQLSLVIDGYAGLGCLFPPSINLDSVLGLFPQGFQNPIGQDSLIPEATPQLCIPPAG